MTEENSKYWGRVKLTHHLARNFKRRYGTYDLAKGCKRSAMWVENERKQ